MRISEIREKIKRYEAALDAVSRNKSYIVDGLSYTRQDASAIQATLDALYARLAWARRGGQAFSVQQAIPRDLPSPCFLWRRHRD